MKHWRLEDQHPVMRFNSASERVHFSLSVSDPLKGSADYYLKMDIFGSMKKNVLEWIRASKIGFSWPKIYQERIPAGVHSFSAYAILFYFFFEKTNIFYPLISTRTCAYQEVRNISFSENFAYILNEWSPDLPSQFSP